jgi:menaquinol-cytochrome c reductase iron-sulfur subunit
MHDSRGSDAGATVDRRGFLGMLSIAAAGVAAACGAVVSLVYTAAPALRAGMGAGAWSRVGDTPADLAAPTRQSVAVVSDAGWARTHATAAVFLDRDDGGQMRAFSARCPHEGCLVDWDTKANQYICPCHASKWTRDGERVAGPTKRGLDPIEVRAGDGGRVEVRYVTYALDSADRVEVG